MSCWPGLPLSSPWDSSRLSLLAICHGLFLSEHFGFVCRLSLLSSHAIACGRIESCRGSELGTCVMSSRHCLGAGSRACFAFHSFCLAPAWLQALQVLSVWSVFLAPSFCSVPCPVPCSHCWQPPSSLPPPGCGADATSSGSRGDLSQDGRASSAWAPLPRTLGAGRGVGLSASCFVFLLDSRPRSLGKPVCPPFYVFPDTERLAHP